MRLTIQNKQVSHLICPTIASKCTIYARFRSKGFSSRRKSKQGRLNQAINFAKNEIKNVFKKFELTLISHKRSTDVKFTTDEEYI